MRVAAWIGADAPARLVDRPAWTTRRAEKDHFEARTRAAWVDDGERTRVGPPSDTRVMGGLLVHFFCRFPCPCCPVLLVVICLLLPALRPRDDDRSSDRSYPVLLLAFGRRHHAEHHVAAVDVERVRAIRVVLAALHRAEHAQVDDLRRLVVGALLLETVQGAVLQDEPALLPALQMPTLLLEPTLLSRANATTEQS